MKNKQLSSPSILEKVYPDISKIFKSEIKPIKDIIKDCIIVLDTNTLLLPYKIGKESLDQIKQAYKTLVKEDRIYIPEQVMREFAKNRPIKLCEIHQQLLAELYYLFETDPSYASNHKALEG